MKKFIVACLTVFLAAPVMLGSPAFSEKDVGFYGPLAEGAWATYEFSSADSKATLNQTWIITNVAGSKITYEIHEAVLGMNLDREGQFDPSQQTGRPSERGSWHRDTIEVNGRMLECDVQVVQGSGKYWWSKEVPFGYVKAEHELQDGQVLQQRLIDWGWKEEIAY